MKKVYLEPSWKMRSISKELIVNPPDGYEFVTLNSAEESMIQAVGRLPFSYSLFHGISKLVPMTLTKSYAEKFRKRPDNTDLTYAFEHLVFRREPWVVDTEYVSLLVGFNTSHFDQYKGIVQRALTSEYCKKIICWHEAARKTILINLPREEISQKLEKVPLAVSKKEFSKQFSGNKIKLFFVGSVNILGEFEIKGGREVLEAFALLNKKYDNLELVIRSDLPQNIKQKYQGYNNIKIIEEHLPLAKLEEEFKSADIFVLPAHNTPWMAFLDAMSFELPIVTIDAWANAEIIEDGKTGLLAKKSEKIPYYEGNAIPAFGMPQFNNAIKTTDPQVVKRLAEKTSILIDNSELRRNMGKVGRWEVEHGKFSIENRNTKLKRIFDEATA
jgi:glycosyltransferase involved in cell wall biosynthesis